MPKFSPEERARLLAKIEERLKRPAVKTRSNAVRAHNIISVSTERRWRKWQADRSDDRVPSMDDVPDMEDVPDMDDVPGNG